MDLMYPPVSPAFLVNTKRFASEPAGLGGCVVLPVLAGCCPAAGYLLPSDFGVAMALDVTVCPCTGDYG